MYGHIPPSGTETRDTARSTFHLAHCIRRTLVLYFGGRGIKRLRAYRYHVLLARP
jgi:hypothetical protein